MVRLLVAVSALLATPALASSEPSTLIAEVHPVAEQIGERADIHDLAARPTGVSRSLLAPDTGGGEFGC